MRKEGGVQMNEQTAFDRGYDAGKNGANLFNCHYSIFGTPELRDAWTEGNKLGIKETGEGT